MIYPYFMCQLGDGAKFSNRAHIFASVDFDSSTFQTKPYMWAEYVFPTSTLQIDYK